MSDDTLSTDPVNFLENDRLLAIDTPLGPDTVLLTRLEGEDCLSRCFLYRCIIETEAPNEAIEGLLSMPVTLWLMNHREDLRRPISGHVRRVVGRGRSRRGARLYELEVVPRLWFLSCTVDCRIFQNLSVPDIIQAIFADEGLTDYVFRIQRTDYPQLEYCVQFQESSLDFVSRLMEHLGLFYWHEHAAGQHMLVIADGNAATGRCQPANLSISPPDGRGELHSLEIDCAFRPGKWALNDYDFQSPTKMLQVSSPTVLQVPRMADHEIYEFPGKFLDVDTGRRLGRMRIELEEAQHRRVFGTGRCVGFDPGRRFSVGTGSSAPIYLLTEVRHRATSPGRGTGEDQATYDNEFVAIRAELPFRPERVTPRPYVRGPQSAVVVGPAGENIYCDAVGRVRVQFQWDRRGQRNDQSSCWMRVTQSRAGANYGTLTIPHVGHEVIVSFLDGDPDRPLITGTVPNTMTMPPVNLPSDKNKTVQRDHGNNKIVMQGKAGGEYVTMASPRAVNLFASGRHVRPLSSGSSYTFSSSPTQNNFGTGSNAGSFAVADASLAGQNTGTSYDIPAFQDPTGLSELWLEWYGTEQSDVAVSGVIDPQTENSVETATEGTYGTQDGNPSTSYLNWGSEGKINCLTLGNNNNWCYGSLNTWVNSTVNTQILGNSNTEVDGEAYTEIKGGSNTIIYKFSATSVLGDSTTSVAASNNSFVGGLNVSVVVGVNTGINLYTNISSTIGMNITANAGGAYTVHDAPSLNSKTDHTDTFLTWTVGAGNTTHTLADYTLNAAYFEVNANMLMFNTDLTLALDAGATLRVSSGLSVIVNGAVVSIG